MTDEWLDNEESLLKAGYHVSSAECEFNQADLPVTGYVDGDDINLEGSGQIELVWIEPEPPEISGLLEREVPVFLVGRRNDNLELNAKITATLENLGVEAMMLEVGQDRKVKAWRCFARYTWESDLPW